MNIGYPSESYPLIRNIINCVPGLDYVKINTSNASAVDITHTFNTVHFTQSPWIATFETLMPRLPNTLAYHHAQNYDNATFIAQRIKQKTVLNALEALSGDSCKKLIALSQCNLNIQQDFLNHFPQYRKAINSKLTCLHPPQAILIDGKGSRAQPLNGPIHFMFVGSSFFRKGGSEILAVFQQLIKQYTGQIKLTIVSALDIDSYATKETVQDVQNAKALIHQHSDWIDYYAYLPYEKVLELMQSAHIGLLPTHADTYGYSVLEFQACGCPVISTNVRALPEINSHESGWIIEVAKNRLGEAIYTHPQDRAKITSQIIQGLTQAVNQIMQNRQVIVDKSAGALHRIRTNHSPRVFAATLGKIYRNT
jgi:glycosyltransferase involved in cell wall biosynthesis